jgi:hypothetical protein
MLKSLFAFAIMLGAALPASAQSPRGIFSEPPEQWIREALATPYAQVLLRNFAASVRKHGDPACLQEKAFDEQKLIARGNALLQRYGLQTARLMEENYDRATYEKSFVASAGPGAVAELARLKRDSDVKKLIALNRPANLARMVETLAEQFDQYVVVGRIKFDPISPVARGEPEPKENPTEAVEAAAQRFIEQRRSKKIQRYLDLQDADATAAPQGFNLQVTAKLGPMTYFAGADRDLAELCVGRR